MAEHAEAQDGHAGHGPDDGHGHGDHHDVSYYYKTYAALLVLFIISVLGPEVGELTGLQSITLFTAFGIAVVKAALVVRNFMHLNVEKAFVHYFLITSLAFMALFFFAVAPDVMKHEGTRWENKAAKSWIQSVEEEYANGGGDHHGGGHAEDHGGDHAEKPAGGEAHGEEGAHH
jgi:caa(3)-type oxidase subunit IV